MGLFRSFFQSRQIRNLMKLATEAIYSEQFDFEHTLNVLSAKTNTLSALMAIKFAIPKDEPVDRTDIKQALSEIRSTEKEFQGTREMEVFLNLLKESTEIDWLEKTNDILERKLAYKSNEYSYEGCIYLAEKTKKGPTTKLERANWKKLAEELKEASLDLERIEAELDEERSKANAQLALNKMIAEMNERRKDMTPEEIQAEIEQAQIDRSKILDELKETLRKNKLD